MGRNAGQALVLVLLLVAVAVTVGLAVVSQSVTEVRTASQSQDVVKAFSASEAGIEQILQQAVVSGTLPGPIAGSFNPSVPAAGSYNASISYLGSGTMQYVLPRNMVSGDAQTLWFVSHGAGNVLGCPCAFLTTGNSFNVYWGTSTADQPPGLLVDVYYKASPADRGTGHYGSEQVARFAFAPLWAGKMANFGAANSSSTTLGGVTFAYQATVSLPNSVPYRFSDGIQMIRARILGATSPPQPVGFDFSGSGVLTGATAGLPAQGFLPVSVVSVPGPSGQGSQSTIQLTSVYPYPDVPSIFDYALFGLGGDITK